MNSNFINKIYFFIIFILPQNEAFANAEHIIPRPIAKTEEAFVHRLLSEKDDLFDYYITQGFIHFPMDVRIAYFDLNDDGKKELFLYIRAGIACGSLGCDLEIFKKVEGNWKSIGTEKSYDNGLIILDKKDGGYREIWAAERLIRWRDGKYD